MYLSALALAACLAEFTFHGTLAVAALIIPLSLALRFFVNMACEDYEYLTIMDAVARKDRKWLTDLYQSWPPVEAPKLEVLQRMIWSRN